jgi:hypothetical protein
VERIEDPAGWAGIKPSRNDPMEQRATRPSSGAWP